MRKKHFKNISKQMLAGMMSAVFVMSYIRMIPAKADLLQENIDADNQIIPFCEGGKVNGQWHFTEKSEDNTSSFENVYYFHGSNNDTEFNGTTNAERNAALVDGDVNTGIDYTGTDVVMIDMGDKEVTKVEIYKAHSTFGYYNFATGDIDGFQDGTFPDVQSLSEDNPVKFIASAGIRLEDATNLTSQPEYNMVRKENLRYEDNKVSITGIDFGRFIILDANNSVWEYISEIKVYTGEMQPLEAVNWANNADKLQDVIIEKADVLGLDLSGYNTLSDYDKMQAIKRLYNNRPETGYATVTDLQNAFDSEVGTYYFLSFGEVQAKITDKSIEVPLYFVSNNSDEHCVGNIQFLMNYDSTALEYRGYKVVKDSLGRSLNTSVSVNNLGSYLDVTIKGNPILNDTDLLDSLLVNFYFAPKSVQNYITYSISAQGVPSLRPLVATNGQTFDYDTVMGCGGFTDGSISFDPKARMTEVTINPESQITSYVTSSRTKSTGNNTVASNIYCFKEIVAGDSTNNELIVDGNSTTTAVYGSTRVVVIDVGDIEISRVEIYNVENNYIFGTGDITSFENNKVPTSLSSTNTSTFTSDASIRLNKTSGWNISYPGNVSYEDNNVVISGIDFGRFLVLDANGSSKKIGEIKLYTSNDEKYVLGDVNNDSAITAIDALLSLKMFSAEEAGFTNNQTLAADYNCDGTVDTKDVLAILKKASWEE